MNFFCFENLWISITYNFGTFGPIQVGFSTKCTAPNEHFNQTENWKCHMFKFRLISLDHITYFLTIIVLFNSRKPGMAVCEVCNNGRHSNKTGARDCGICLPGKPIEFVWSNLHHMFVLWLVNLTLPFYLPLMQRGYLLLKVNIKIFQLGAAFFNTWWNHTKHLYSMVGLLCFELVRKSKNGNFIAEKIYWNLSHFSLSN